MRTELKLVLAGLVLSAASCTTPEKSSRPQAEWISNMHQLSHAHLSLMPVVADSQKFSDPARRKEISANLKSMVEAAANLVNDGKAPDADPIIAFNASELAREVRQSYVSFERGDQQWSRFSFNRASSYCISCHTRADRGIRDFEVPWNPELSGLNRIQTIEHLLANRRYSSALAQARTLAADERLVLTDPNGWLVTLEKVMGMVVRVNGDPLQAEALASLITGNAAAPSYMRRMAVGWLKDSRAWRQEEREGKKPDKFSQAVKLVKRAQSAGPRDPRSLVLYLRASGKFHELLENSKASTYAESMYWAGIVEGALRELNMGSLDQYYFETCIRTEPHSAMAETCLARLETSMRDANPFIELEPGSEFAYAIRLGELRKLAELNDPENFRKGTRHSWDYDFPGSGDEKKK